MSVLVALTHDSGFARIRPEAAITVVESSCACVAASGSSVWGSKTQEPTKTIDEPFESTGRRQHVCRGPVDVEQQSRGLIHVKLKSDTVKPSSSPLSSTLRLDRMDERRPVGCGRQGLKQQRNLYTLSVCSANLQPEVCFRNSQTNLEKKTAPSSRSSFAASAHPRLGSPPANRCALRSTTHGNTPDSPARPLGFPSGSWTDRPRRLPPR